MKIGITCHPTFGGSGAVATELGLELATRGHEVHFISYAQPFRLSGFQERVFFHEVEMDQYPLFEHPPYSLALAVALHDATLNHGLDLIHVHYAIPHAASAWMAREMLGGGAGAPKILTTLHGTDITLVGQHPSFKSITRFSILQSDGISAVSSYLRDETESNFAIDPARIEVIPNFIDITRYKRVQDPCHRAALAPGGEPIVMHISNFRPVKRIEDVVKAFARIVAQMPARLVLVGDGPDRARAQQLAESLGILPSLLFLGKYAAVEELLASADLFLLPSESESFGLAALEAMACGVPVVASHVGGLPEVVTEDAGVLLSLGDADGMGDAAVEILRDRTRWAQMSAAARRVAETRFSAERIVPVYESWYEQVLQTKAGGVE